MDTAGTFTAVFTYPYEGSLRIAIDHFYMVMEYTTTLAVYEYDGNDLVFLSDNGYVQTGQGDLLARYAQYDPGEAAALTCSEWRGIMAGDTAWQTLEKYDIEEHDWAAASPDDEARIRDLYTALLEEEGLAVSDHRTLIHVSDAGMNGYNSDYDLRQAVTPDLKGAAAFDPTASAARCKVVSLIRDISDGASDGRDTFRNRPAQGSNVLRKGENANPTGMVRRIGY
jgi:hypothetical protein